MLIHKTTWDEADRLSLKAGTKVGLVPLKSVNGVKKWNVYLGGKLIAENFTLTQKED